MNDIQAILHVRRTKFTGNPYRRSDTVVVSGLTAEQLFLLTGPSGLGERCSGGGGHMHGMALGRKVSTFGRMLDSEELAILVSHTDADRIRDLQASLGDRAEVVLVDDWSGNHQWLHRDNLSEEEQVALDSDPFDNDPFRETPGITVVSGENLFDFLAALGASSRDRRDDRLDAAGLDDMYELFEQE